MNPSFPPWEGRWIVIEALVLRREEFFSLQHTDEKRMHLYYSFHTSKHKNPPGNLLAIRTFPDSDSIRFCIFNKYPK